MLFHYIHPHQIYRAIFRYYYDESEDDIDDYSRKPVFYQYAILDMRICRIYIVDFLSAQNHNKITTESPFHNDETADQVPILLSILLVIIYIVGGAFLFQMWEGWPFLDRCSLIF